MVRIKFGNLDINEIKDTSGVFSGINTPANWRYTSKSTEGFGKVDGDKNHIQENITIVKKK